MGEPGTRKVKTGWDMKSKKLWVMVVIATLISTAASAAGVKRTLEAEKYKAAPSVSEKTDQSKGPTEKSVEYFGFEVIREGGSVPSDLLRTPPSDDVPTWVSCAEAYERIAEARHDLTRVCGTTSASGEIGAISMDCFSVPSEGGTVSEAILGDSINRGDVSPTDLGRCIEGEMTSSWPPQCFKANGISRIFENIYGDLAEGGWTLGALDPGSPINQPDSLYYGGVGSFRQALPYFVLGNFSDSARGWIVLRWVTPWSCVSRLLDQMYRGNLTICVNRNIQSFENQCRGR